MVFDTDVLIWAMRGNPGAAEVIDAEPSPSLSAISYMELLKGARDLQEQRLIKRFLHDVGFELLPVSTNVSHRAIVYMEAFFLSSGLDLADALIAATATECGFRLCTANDQHYRIVPDLELLVFRP